MGSQPRAFPWPATFSLGGLTRKCDLRAGASRYRRTMWAKLATGAFILTMAALVVAIIFLFFDPTVFLPK
jgi:hypothetical protein